MPEPKEQKAYRVTMEHGWTHGEYMVVAGDFGEAADKALARDIATVDPNDPAGPPSTKVKGVTLYGAADMIIP